MRDVRRARADRLVEEVDVTYTDVMSPETVDLLKLWRGAGRVSLRGVRDPSIDWELAERLYVEGELVGEAEHTRRVYPKRAEIARRAGTTQNTLDGRAKRCKWLEKRIAWQNEHGVIPDAHQASRQLLGEPTGVRKPARPALAGVRQTLVAYIDLFREAVDRRTLKHDTVTDLDKAVRLLAYVDGHAESIKATHATVTLEVMAQRHGALRTQAHAQVDDEVAGVLGTGEVIDTVGVPAPEDGKAA